MVIDKDGLRVFFKKRVQQVNSNEKRRQSHLICDRLQNFLQKQTGIWTLFAPLNDEPDLTSLVKTCTHINWAFPRVESKTLMQFYKLSCLDEMVSSSWGIEEPVAKNECLVSAQTISGCIIPGMAFDFFGNRLGRGGGYYDRFLSTFKGLKLGVTFDQALTSERLPSESHDQKLDFVISSQEWIEVDQSEVRHGY